MLIYLDGVSELKAIEIGLMYYKRENLNKPQSAILIPFINKLIDKIDKEIEYYETTE